MKGLICKAASQAMAFFSSEENARTFILDHFPEFFHTTAPAEPYKIIVNEMCYKHLDTTNVRSPFASITKFFTTLILNPIGTVNK